MTRENTITTPNMKVTTLGKNYEMMCEMRWKHVVEIWGLKMDGKQIM
jgi:hypothetical protein